MRAKLANLNYCAVPYLSRATNNMCRHLNCGSCDGVFLGSDGYHATDIVDTLLVDTPRTN